MPEEETTTTTESKVERIEHPIEHPKPAPKVEPEHVIIERDTVFNPNTCSILSFIFAWFVPFLGYPFGIIGKERAKRTGDVTGRKLANAGYILSIVFYIACCAVGMVFAWIDWWSTGLIVTLVLIVFSLIYFPLCDRLKKDK